MLFFVYAAENSATLQRNTSHVHYKRI